MKVAALELVGLELVGIELGIELVAIVAIELVGIDFVGLVRTRLEDTQTQSGIESPQQVRPEIVDTERPVPRNLRFEGRPGFAHSAGIVTE